MNKRSLLNKTIQITEGDRGLLKSKILKISSKKAKEDVLNRVILGDWFQIFSYFPEKFVDVLVLDPPYNMCKKFEESKFKKVSISDYSQYIERLLLTVLPLLKDTATIYICSEWFSSLSVFDVCSKYFSIRNRITWKRDKGRGSKTNWKNLHEDIWYCTMSNQYTFNVNAVKSRVKVTAPYKTNGIPKDWESTSQGNFRNTYPSNMWCDVTVPFWSMKENTEHPTQKPEKLLAKLILASSNEGDVIFDPMQGSGTTSVVSKKLNRCFVGVDSNLEYSLYTQKRLENANINNNIQGYSNGVFL